MCGPLAIPIAMAVVTVAIREMPAGEKGLAAILNVARQFVKDNGIEAIAAPGSPLGNLTDNLTKYPFDPNADGVH